jgi:hypothetical protein
VNKKGFPRDEAEFRADNVYKQYMDVRIPFKIFGDRVEIQMKDAMERIFEEQGITGFNPKTVDMIIPFSIDQEATGEVMKVRLNKKRYTIRVKRGDIIPSKVVKIDTDNTHPHRWEAMQWLKYIQDLFYEFYDVKPFDLTVTRGKDSLELVKKKNLVKKLVYRIKAIKEFKTDEVSVRDYLRWTFENKAGKMNLGLGLICHEGMIADWAIEVQKKKKKGNRRAKREVKWGKRS